jgi:hypothetical protein
MKGLGVLCAVLLAPAVGLAAEDEIEKALGDTAGGEAAPAEDLPEIGEDKLQEFVLERGFYFSGDLGVFMTVGGVKGLSNVQPFMALQAGFDVNKFLSVQAALSTGYVSGNPVSANDDPVVNPGGATTTNYGLISVGGEVVLAVRPTERIALEPKVGGGITFVNPEITDPNDPNATLGSSTPHVVGGVDFKYLTLLTDFTAGISVAGYYLLTPAVLGVSTAFVVRYTF